MIFRGNYIEGQFRPLRRGSEVISEDPGDLDHPIGTFRVATQKEVEHAVESARRGFLTWKRTPFKERERCAARFQVALQKRRHELARLISQEMGKPLQDAVQEVNRMIERVPLARKEAARLTQGKSFPMKKGLQGVLRYKPRGVFVIIGPFNFPGHIPNNQILSAILLGNSVIFKPSELTPFVGQVLGELWHAAKLPKGVMNVLQGGGLVGRLLSGHDEVNAVIFTGSYGTGQKIQEETTHQIGKLIALEMGGKNALIVSRHAALDEAAEHALLGAFSMAGQRCNATSRIILEKKIASSFLKKFMMRLREVKVGYALDRGSFLGPLVNENALKKYLLRTKLARKEKFQILQEAKPLRMSRRGYYAQPSVCLKEVHRGVSLRGTFTEEEIFGPNAAIYIVDSLAEAARVHNMSSYGLVASFFSKKKKEYHAMFDELEVGLLNWNRGTIFSSPFLPFGGLKQSGNHHPVGAFVPYLCTYPVSLLEKQIATRKLK